MTTVDFELEIGRNTGESYPVAARTDGDQVAAGQLPVSAVQDLDRELGGLRAAVLASAPAGTETPTAETRTADEVAESDRKIRALGQRLFQAVMTGQVRELYRAARDRAARDRATDHTTQDTAVPGLAPLRLVLGIRPVELHRLPWEFLFDPDRAEYLALTLPAGRTAEPLAPRQPLALGGPLRVLGMVVHPHGGDPVQLGPERARLGAALRGVQASGVVELDWVNGHNLNHLAEALRRGPWHALHLFASTERDNDALRAAKTLGWLLGTDEFAQVLADHDPLRLLVLSAPVTESGAVAEAFCPAVVTLLRRGIPAVVSPQFGISDPAESDAVRVLYRGVARGMPVDLALLRARWAVRLGQKDTLEWASPVLYQRAPGGQIFEPAGVAAGDGDYDAALDLFLAQRWDEAVVALGEVLARSPDHPDAAGTLRRAQQELARRLTEQKEQAEQDTPEGPEGPDGRSAAEPAERAGETATQPGTAGGSVPRQEQEQKQQQQQQQADRAQPQIRQVLQTRGEINAVAFSPDGRWLATAGGRNVAQIWDLASGQELLAVGSRAWRRVLDGVAFSPDGKRLATAGNDRTARAWDTSTGELQLTLTHKGRVSGVTFSPDGWRLATASDDCSARIWHAVTGSELARFPHDNWVRSVAFSPDGKRLATAGIDRIARIWDALGGAEQLALAHGCLLWGVAFSPDGRWLATAGDDGTARIWDTTSGAELHALAHRAPVWAVAFSPDGHGLATLSDDRVARIWDATSGEALGAVVHVEQVWAIAFHPDGTQLATGGIDRTVRVWELNPSP